MTVPIDESSLTPPVPAPPTPPATQPAAPPISPTPTAPPAGPPQIPVSRAKPPRATIIALVVMLVFACCIAGSFLALLVNGFTRSPGVSFTPPKQESLVTTEEWGVVPAGYIGVMLGDDAARATAEKVADQLDGEIVGEVAEAGIYQIRVDATDEAGLRKALEAARRIDGVELAFPDQALVLDAEGVRCTPLAETIYSGKDGRTFQVTGVQRAWDTLHASGLPLSPVHVAVLDDGLYRPTDEFEGAVRVDTSGAEDSLSDRTTDSAGKVHQYGSHGTVVTSIIAANPDNAGVAGAASVLGEKMRVSMTNVYGAEYGTNTSVKAAKDEASYVDRNGNAWAIGALAAIKKQVSDGATIVNCSWGNSNATPELAAAYKRFFEKMAKDKPNVLFVCSAGNEGKSLDGSKRIPSGTGLPNMITVGAVDGEGARASFSNTNGKGYTVDIAAPGVGIPAGIDDDGAVITGDGTSYATPQVTATAAMLRALDPSLDAAAIKELILATASPGVTNAAGTQSIPAPTELGGRVLSTDFAVLAAVNNMRAAKGLDPLDGESLNSMLITLTAEKTADGTWMLRAEVPDVDPKGTSVNLTYNGAGSIVGRTTQKLAKSGTVGWKVTVSGEAMTVHVKRADTRACWRIVLRSDEASGAAEPQAPVAPEAYTGNYLSKVTVVGASMRDSETLVSVDKTYTLTGTARGAKSVVVNVYADRGNWELEKKVEMKAIPDPNSPGIVTLTGRLSLPTNTRHWMLRMVEADPNGMTSPYIPLRQE